MRCFEPLLWQSGGGSITDVELDPDSRDDIPQLLLGLQYLYMIPALRAQVLQILDAMIPEEIDRTTGRPGRAHDPPGQQGSLNTLAHTRSPGLAGNRIYD